MQKPAIIDTPFPTVVEMAREHGVSKAERKRIERQVAEFLKRDGQIRRFSGRRVAGRAAARKARKK
ncbi:MAG: hypothetical protein DMF78_25925 [Acidobacteria bacterium]|nr:MAG: hypothetical protein DMF78_25925 [Acidobacteriota bacterium]